MYLCILPTPRRDCTHTYIVSCALSHTFIDSGFGLSPPTMFRLVRFVHIPFPFSEHTSYFTLPLPFILHATLNTPSILYLFFLTLFSCFHSISGRHIHALQALYFDPGDHSVCMYSSVCRMCLLLPSEIHAIRSGDDSDVIERRGVRGPISVTAVLSHNEQDIRLIV